MNKIHISDYYKVGGGELVWWGIRVCTLYLVISFIAPLCSFNCIIVLLICIILIT